MKRHLLIIVIMILVQSLWAQVWLKGIKIDNVKEPSFFEFQEAFNNYWKDYNVVGGKYVKNNKVLKAPGWKQFKRWEWYWEPRINKETGEFPITTSVKEFEKYKQSGFKFKSTSGNWTSYGPSTVGGGYDGLGRINCISFHPTNENIFWVGSPSGGLWGTIDAGASWTVVTDNNPVLGVSDIAIPADYEVSNTIYIATGDRDGGSSWTLGGGNSADNHSIGVLKSNDGGISWVEAGLNNDVAVNAKMGFLRIHPNDNSILYAGLGGNIYKTTDKTDHWVEMYTNDDYIIDFEFNPDNPSIVYAATKNSKDGNVKIIRSIDDGVNWTVEHEFEDTDGRIELAVTKANSNYVYAIVAKTWGGLSGIYKSIDTANNFTQVFDGTLSGNSLLGWYGDGSGDNNGQGNYDLALTVSSVDENLLYLGGVNTWRSRDGGTSWGNVSVWTSYSDYNPTNVAEVHADKHCLKYNGDVLYEGNDGGIYRSFDGTNWTDLSNGLVISQMYRIGVSASTPNKIISGLQDNGSKLTEDQSWYDVKGGDGMECLIDYTNSSIQYATYINGQISRTVNNWGSSTDINENIGDGTLEGSWVTPYIINPINPETIYVGYQSVWRSTDRGNTFTRYSTISTGDDFRSMAMAPSDTSVMYIADQTNIWRTVNGGANWDVVTGSLPTSSNSITYIAVHNNDPSLVWVTIGGYGNNHVFESINGGDSWKNISDGLPNLPTFSIVQNKLVTSSNHLYVGTDIGVFMKDNEEDWVEFSSGLPNVMVTELEIFYNDILPENSKLYAATYGRGLWVSDLKQSPNVNLDANLYRILEPIEKNYCGESSFVPTIVIRNNGTDTIRSFKLSYTINGENIKTYDWAGILTSGNIKPILFDTIISGIGNYVFEAKISEVNNDIDEVLDNNSKSIEYSVVKSEISFPFFEGFNSSYLPGCWSSELVNNIGPIGTPQLTFVEASLETSVLPIEGSHMLEFNSLQSDKQDKVRLISPQISNLSGEVLNVMFSWYEDNGGVRKYDSIMVQWSLNGADWQDIKSFTRYNADNPGWVPKSVVLPLDTLQSASIYLGFLFTSRNGNNCYLDNLSILSDQALFNLGEITTQKYYVSDSKSADINIPITSNNKLLEANVFTTYLSDADGSFTNEIEIGSINSDTSGSVLATIPFGTLSGQAYKVRIKSSYPIYVSNESESLEVVLDTIHPELSISSDVGSSTSVSPIIVKFSFSEEVQGFELSDIVVINGTAANFSSTSSLDYQVEIIPLSFGTLTVHVPENVVVDVVDNSNIAAMPWSTQYSSGVGIEELNRAGIAIFPNPSKGLFKVEFSNSYKYATIKILNLSGAIISSIDLNNSSIYNFDLSSNPKGIYIIQIIIDDKTFNTQLILN